MNPEVKAAWLEALRSGRYEQGQRQLRDGPKFCCLGVLCDLHSRATGRTWEEPTDNRPVNGGWWRYITRGADLPGEVMEWAGLDSADPKLAHSYNEERRDGNETCSEFNDGCYGAIHSFAEIADMIERRL